MAVSIDVSYSRVSGVPHFVTKLLGLLLLGLHPWLWPIFRSLHSCLLLVLCCCLAN